MPEQVLDDPDIHTLFAEMVAKLCRKVWTVTSSSRPAASAADRKARCKDRIVTGFDG
jgi:hypothetical protein